MTDQEMVTVNDADVSAEADTTVRVYEAGYHILSTVKEEEVEPLVQELRSEVEKAGGSLIAEGAPQLLKLAYSMFVNLGGKHQEYDKAYFGWLKFECTGEGAVAIQEALRAHDNILRALVFKTVREDTRANMRPTVLREVRRTDTIASARRANPDEDKGEVSEEALDKSLEELTAE